MRGVLFASLLFLTGCIVPAPSNESAPQKAVPAAPPAQVNVGANLGDKIEIASLIINPSRGTPGQPINVNAFYKVLDDVQIDYMVFVHVEDVDGRSDRLNVDHAPAGGQNPTSRWKKGDTIRDDFQIYVPPNMQVRGLNVLMGFWDPKTDARLPLKNPDQVRSDNNNRILVAQIPIGPAGQ